MCLSSAVELAGATSADGRVNLQCLAAVTLRAILPSTARIGYQSVETGVVGLNSLAGGHAGTPLVSTRIVAPVGNGSRRGTEGNGMIELPDIAWTRESRA
jgi:hypothetical protein